MPTLSLKRRVNHVNRMVGHRAAHSLAMRKVLALAKMPDEMALKAVVSLKVEIKLHQMQKADQHETTPALLDLQIASLETLKATHRVVIHKMQIQKICQKQRVIKRCLSQRYFHLKTQMVISIVAVQTMAALDARILTLAVSIAPVVEVVKT